MIRTVAIFILLTLNACGWAEWPPPPEWPRAANRPEQNIFIGADAVIVGRGDTVYGLSRRHKVSARAIIEANNLNPPYHLNVGQRLVLPRGRAHEVKGGDTLGGIAEAYRVNMYDMARLNGLKPPYTIQIGERLRLPGGSVMQAARAQPKDTAKEAAPPKRTSIASSKSMKPSTVPPPPAASGKGFLWPVRGKVLSSYGAKSKGLQNDGVNIAAPRGAPVMATENGVVAYAGNELRGFGNLLLIKHSGGWVSAYAHNEALLVKRGEKIRKGQAIAKVGSSGSVSSPQLHFELRRGKRAVNPLKHLPKA
ncbi:MAG: M23 family metallopeptidase [Rhodospirillaceae bacterium]|nr:M23 family metallopeptidase [Rhodospirillaceae bacterium]